MALLQGASRSSSSSSSPPSSSSSPPPSSSSPPWRYQVFLSFRGEDTRNNFTAHLYKALVQKGINTYIDNNLERGEEISPALLEAMKGSKISIIILSPHYASSTWCLKELMKILECQERKQQIVIPVFYHVDPSDVRHQTNSFEEDFAKHEVRFKDHKEINVQLWKDALTKVCNFSGFHLTKEKNESELIDEIIQWVEKSIVPHTSLHGDYEDHEDNDDYDDSGDYEDEDSGDYEDHEDNDDSDDSGDYEDHEDSGDSEDHEDSDDFGDYEDHEDSEDSDDYQDSDDYEDYEEAEPTF